MDLDYDCVLQSPPLPQNVRVCYCALLRSPNEIEQ
jgi:hypothetical protein